MKNDKPLSPDERFQALAKRTPAALIKGKMQELIDEVEALKLEFPEWAEKNFPEEIDEDDEWEEIVQPKTYFERYYGTYYHSCLSRLLVNDPLKPEQFLTEEEIMKMELKYFSGRKAHKN